MPLDSCPECHVSFEDLSAEEVQEHRNHWPDDIPFPSTNKEAVRRAAAIESEANSRRRTEARSSAKRLLSEEEK